MSLIFSGLFIAFAYGFIGGQWASFANREQTRLYGFSLIRNILVINLNLFFWPICMIIAIVKGRI